MVTLGLELLLPYDTLVLYFLRVSEQKYKEKREFEKLKTDVNSMKNDLDEIKSMLKSIVCD